MNHRKEREIDWQGWLLPGAGLLAAAAVLVVAVVTSQQASGPSPAPASPDPSPTGDEHEVTTDHGRYWFGIVGSELVVRQLTDSSAVDLGRVTLLSVASGAPGTSPHAEGSGMFAMACPPADGTTRRFVFGHLDVTDEIEYSGPDADGHGASDGLFLFALRPGATAGAISVAGTRPNSPKAGMPGSVWDLVATDGKKQASGCLVLE